MRNRRFAAVVATTAIAIAACASTAVPSAPNVAQSAVPSTAPGGSSSVTPSAAGACVVGVSWNNYTEERWARWDEPAIKTALAAGGASYISNDAKSSAETQAGNVEGLIARGARVIILVAQDGTAIKAAVTAAIAAGVQVIAYDHLIDSPKALYVSFDNVLVGRLEAQAVLNAVSKGSFAIIKGSKTDPDSTFLRSGMVQAGVPDVGQSSAGITIVGETYTDNWDQAKARTEMEQILAVKGTKVDAVLAESDGIAGGVIAALTAQGLAGRVPVSGQGGDGAGLNRVALGTQTVDVLKDARMLGKAAGDAAAQLCKNPDIAKIAGVGTFKSPAGNDLTSILLTPQAITRVTLNVVLDAGWIQKADLCKGVANGAVSVCG
jgi:D-xylose transport system substrate-binding protein